MKKYSKNLFFVYPEQDSNLGPQGYQSRVLPQDHGSMIENCAHLSCI